MNRVPQRKKHQRAIRCSVVVPARVELIVGTDDDKPSEDSAWEIVAVRDVRCDASAQTISENMHFEDFERLVARAAKAKDIQS